MRTDGDIHSLRSTPMPGAAHRPAAPAARRWVAGTALRVLALTLCLASPAPAQVWSFASRDSAGGAPKTEGFLGFSIRISATEDFFGLQGQPTFNIADIPADDADGNVGGQQVNLHIDLVSLAPNSGGLFTPQFDATTQTTWIDINIKQASGGGGGGHTP